jgi:hypothetical protein
MKTPKQITGYHFTGDTLRDGRPIPTVGAWLKHEGDIIVCQSGLHASKHPFDALQYAPGNKLHKVILRGDLQTHGEPIDKYVGRERKILATIDAEKLLRDFARGSALKVMHLWNAPEIVKDYLETGDESLRAAARDAAWDTAWAVARDAAWDAAWDTAWDAAWAVARYSARDAAWDTARDAAWTSARAAVFKKSTNNARRKFASMAKEAFSKQ